METVSAGGAELPKLGVGTWQLSDDECRRAVEAALELGYRHVDTAAAYDNEAAVGDAIAAADVDRDDVFLTTKVWRSNLRRGDVRPALEASLERLDVSSVDLLLIHWPHRLVPVRETLDAMAELREDGLVRHVGVSNYTRSGLAEAIDAAASLGVEIVTNQVQYHPFVDQRELLADCRDAGVALTAYSPLAHGDAIGHDELAAIGERYDRSAAQVALRWLVQQEGVVAIPRSSSRAHLAANLDVFDFQLTGDEMVRIHELTGGVRTRLRNALPRLMRLFPF